MSNLTNAVYRVFDPDEPLPPEKNELYVDLDDVRGGADVVRRLGNAIRRAGHPTCQLLAGHRGSGKTTELLRLRRELESGPVKYFAVLCDADRDVDRNDVDFPDVLGAIVRQTAAQLRERCEIELQPGYFRDRWERLRKLLGSELEFTDLSLEAGMLQLTTAIKASPDARAKIREFLEPDTGNWIAAANDVIGQAASRLQQRGYSGLVILVDDLDKMVLRPHEKAGCSTAEYLFVHREGQLTGFQCHMVYSLPIALAYSAQASTLRSLYGGSIPVVPMTKVATRPPDNNPHGAGIEKFRQLIEARLRSIGASDREVFESEEVREEIIRLSGGQPRELMILIRDAFARGDLPITTQGLALATRELRRSYARQLTAEAWTVIEHVRSTGRTDPSADHDAIMRVLLDSRAVLAYANEEDEEWYNLNPIVRDLRPPGESREA